MKLKQSYWIFQIVGWSIFVFSELFNYYFIFDFKFSEFETMLFNSFLNIILGVLLTHIFRLIFINYHWIKLSIPQLILRSALGAVIITSLLTAININMEDNVLDFSNINWVLTDINYFLSIGKPVLMWILIYIFYAYSIEQQNSKIETIKLQNSIEASEAKILRAQVNPHFMFNALNSIRALIFEDPQKAQKALTQLSNLLRSSLVADRKSTIPLSEELRTVEDYLALEKIRYEDRLQIRWQIDENTKSIHVPPMMLQTLVENAIKHGVQKAIGWGFLAISSRLNNNFLIIQIRNSGNLNSTENLSEDGGFGLKNTEKRIKLLFGASASFEIFQEENQIVCANIKIPYI